MPKDEEKKKKPLTKEEKTKSRAVKIDWQFEILRTFLAIFISLAVVTVIVLFISDEPGQAIQSLLIGPFTTLRRFGNVIELMIPLTFTGLAITVVFRSERFNLSADGAFYAGSMIAAAVGLISPFPPLISIIIAFLIALVVGGVIGYIPAIVQKKFGANELVTSLMLNYVVNYSVKYVFNYNLRDPQKSSLQSYPMPEKFQLRNLIPGTRIHSGIIIMAVVVFIVWFVLYRTRWGYSLRATGANEKFAKYSGIKVGLVVILAQSIGTALASLGGAIEMLGLHKTFKWKENPGFGFDGVIISTLANGNPALVPLAAFFLSYVRVGADILNRTTQIPAEIVAIVQAIIILLVAAQAFLAKTKHKVLVRNTGAIDQLESEEA